MQQDEHDQELCRKALHWIGISYEYLDPLALCEAISIPDDEDMVDKELLVDPEWVSRSCSSLIRLAGQPSNHPHFQLAHFTVKEYLRSIRAQSKRSAFRFSEDEAVRDLTKTSLRLLTFQEFERPPMVASSEIQRMELRNEQHPFYVFAAVHMFNPGILDVLHLCLEEDTMMRYARELFSPEKRGIFISWLLQVIWNWTGATFDQDDFSDIVGLVIAPEFSTLHIAAILALPSVCKHLIDTEKVDLNICSQRGTPLHALLAGAAILHPRLSEYKSENHHRWRISSNPRVYDQLQQCLETFIQHGADTSIRWNTASVFQMAINNSVRTVHKQSWIEPLIVPSTIIHEDCILHFKAELAAGSIDRSILDAIVALSSEPEVSYGWTRLASLIKTRRMEETDYGECDVPLGLQGSLSDEDFIDGLRISLDQKLTDTLRIFVRDSRFRPDIYIPCGNSTSMPILHFAIGSRGLSSVELLLEAGCNPSVVHESYGYTSLHACAFMDTDDGAITTLLLKSGVVDSARDNDGKTCWHCAAEKGNITVLKVLLDLGCDTKQSLATTSNAGRTPLASAILGKEVESALVLLDHCSTDSNAFQSDQSLLDQAAAIGSTDLFQRLHDKLEQAGATRELQGAKPLDHINMVCSPKLLDYLLDSWPAGSINDSHVLEGYLLDANSGFFKDPAMYPPRDDMAHIIRRLLPSIDIGDDVEGTTPQQFWNTFCEEVVPYLTKTCDHQESQCRTDLIIMIFEILIEVGVLSSFERNAHIPSYRTYFRSLVGRNHLQCSWITSSAQKILAATSLQVDLANEAVAGELLLCALQQSNIDLVRQLLDRGVDVHAAHGLLSPVEQACYGSYLPSFHSVIENSDKTRINGAGSQGKTWLHWVVSGTVPGYLAKIEKLLDLGANIDSEVEDSHGDTALTLASRTHRQDIVALLVAKGANSLHRARDGWTIVHAAAATGDLRYIHALISQEIPSSFWLATCEASLINRNGRPHITQKTTAIHLAARDGRSGILRYMSRNRVPFDVDAVTGHPRLRPLHVACLSGHLDVVEFLISSKVNVNVRDADGQLPIDYARRDGRLEIFKCLIKAGSEVPLRHLSASIQRLMSRESEYILDSDSEGISQFNFERAIVRGDINYCKELVGRGQSVNAKLLTTPYTPLVCAMVEGQIEIVDWLVSIGIEVTNPDSEALHPSLRCIASLATHYISSPQTLATVLTLALEQNANWYGSILSPLHVAILDNTAGRLKIILKHIRENNHAYRYDSAS